MLSRKSARRLESDNVNSRDIVVVAGISITSTFTVWNFDAVNHYLSVTPPEFHLRFVVEQAVIGQISGARIPRTEVLLNSHAKRTCSVHSLAFFILLVTGSYWNCQSLVSY